MMDTRDDNFFVHLWSSTNCEIEPKYWFIYCPRLWLPMQFVIMVSVPHRSGQLAVFWLNEDGDNATADHSCVFVSLAG